VDNGATHIVRSEAYVKGDGGVEAIESICR
jgi:hypothetical protein